MTSTDWIIDITLIGLVLLQVRGRRLTVRSLLLPVAVVAYVAVKYLGSVPSGGADLVLVVVCAAVGTALGTLAGLWTRVSVGADGHPVARAGAVAATLWVLGVGFRLAFQLYATHGGGVHIYNFDVAHGLGTSAWVAALVLMALGEALARTAVIGARAFLPARGAARPVRA